MASRLRENIVYALLATPGWIFLATGLALSAAMLLVPPYLECRQLAWQRDLVRLQAQCLAEQEQGYAQFVEALKSDDPVLLERLAYHYLRQKPAGVHLVNNRITQHGQWSQVMFARDGGAAATTARPFAAESFSTAERWLHRPMPQVGQDYPAFQPLQSRLTRIATGPARLVLLLGALGCVVIGMLGPFSQRRVAGAIVPKAPPADPAPTSVGAPGALAMLPAPSGRSPATEAGDAGTAATAAQPPAGATPAATVAEPPDESAVSDETLDPPAPPATHQLPTRLT